MVCCVFIFASGSNVADVSVVCSLALGVALSRAIVNMESSGTTSTIDCCVNESSAKHSFSMNCVKSAWRWCITSPSASSRGDFNSESEEFLTTFDLFLPFLFSFGRNFLSNPCGISWTFVPQSIASVVSKIISKKSRRLSITSDTGVCWELRISSIFLQPNVCCCKSSGSGGCRTSLSSVLRRSRFILERIVGKSSVEETLLSVTEICAMLADKSSCWYTPEELFLPLSMLICEFAVKLLFAASAYFVGTISYPSNPHTAFSIFPQKLYRMSSMFWSCRFSFCCAVSRSCRGTVSSASLFCRLSSRTIQDSSFFVNVSTLIEEQVLFSVAKDVIGLSCFSSAMFDKSQGSDIVERMTSFRSSLLSVHEQSIDFIGTIFVLSLFSVIEAL